MFDGQVGSARLAKHGMESGLEGELAFTDAWWWAGNHGSDHVIQPLQPLEMDEHEALEKQQRHPNARSSW